MADDESSPAVETLPGLKDDQSDQESIPVSSATTEVTAFSPDVASGSSGELPFDACTSNLCDFDCAVIREHCLCKDCKDVFTTQQDLLSLFEDNCPGCPVRSSRREIVVADSPVRSKASNDISIAEGQDEINEEHLFCCMDKRNGNRHYMKDAKFLPCLHHFCRDCLHQEAQRQLQNRGRDYNEDDDEDDDNAEAEKIAFICPECSDNINALANATIKPNGEVTFDELESISLKHIVDTFAFEKRLVNGEELCDQCFEENRQKAIAECVSEGDTMIPLCEDCLRRHKSGRATKEHKVILAEHLQTPSPERFAHYKAPFCKTHKRSRICMYCPVHMTVVCMKCAREEAHEDCRGLFDVEAHFDGETSREYREDFEKLKERTNLLSNNINTAIRSIELKIGEISRRCDDIVTEVNSRSSCLKREIEHKRKILINQTCIISQLKKEDFNIHVQRLQTIKADIDYSLGWIQNFQNSIIPINFYLFKRRMQLKMESFNKFRNRCQEDDQLMNARIWHKTDPIDRLEEFKPFCTSFLGVVYSTPCLRNFDVRRSHKLTLVCRDIFGTMLCNSLPDIEAKLLITEFTNVPSSCNAIDATIECTVVKDKKEGIYNFKTNVESYYPGIYCLLISYTNPSAIFQYNEYGKMYKLKYTSGTGFEMLP